MVVSKKPDLPSTQWIIDNLIPVDVYARRNIQPHIAFKAVNYRPQKRTECRSLIVSYNYSMEENGYILYTMNTSRALKEDSREVEQRTPLEVLSAVQREGVFTCYQRGRVQKMG